MTGISLFIFLPEKKQHDFFPFLYFVFETSQIEMNIRLGHTHKDPDVHHL